MQLVFPVNRLNRAKNICFDTLFSKLDTYYIWTSWRLTFCNDFLPSYHHVRQLRYQSGQRPKKETPSYQAMTELIYSFRSIYYHEMYILLTEKFWLLRKVHALFIENIGPTCRLERPHIAGAMIKRWSECILRWS